MSLFFDPIADLVQESGIARARRAHNEDGLPRIRVTGDPLEYLPAFILLLADRPLSRLRMLPSLAPSVGPARLHVHAVHEVFECQCNPFPGLLQFFALFWIHHFNGLLVIALKIDCTIHFYLLVICCPYLTLNLLFN